MLVKFSVKNYKQFKEEIVFDLSAGNYSFNEECVKDGVVKTALIYGANGTGKTNIGQAVLNAFGHLNIISSTDQFIANGFTPKNNVEFSLLFNFFGKNLHYKYVTNPVNEILSEQLIIDNQEIINYELGKPFVTNLKNTANLNKKLNATQNISALLYIINNSNLDINDPNSKIFIEFMSFTKHMVWVQGLTKDMKVLGFTSNRNLSTSIIESGNLESFESFLNENGVHCKLKAVNNFNRLDIAFDLDGVYLPFLDTASTGTIHLLTLFFWLIEIEERNIPLLFIDEFDAAYHFKLSSNIVKKLKQLPDTQVILTTHNTNLLNNDLIRPDCGFIINGKEIKALQDCTVRELRQAHNLEKMYKAGAFSV